MPAAVADTVSDNAVDGARRHRRKQYYHPVRDRRQEMAVTASDYVSLLKANPAWITSPQSDAIWLKDNQEYIVRHTNGNPVSIPFSSPPLPSRTHIADDNAAHATASAAGSATSSAAATSASGTNGDGRRHPWVISSPTAIPTSRR